MQGRGCRTGRWPARSPTPQAARPTPRLRVYALGLTMPHPAQCHRRDGPRCPSQALGDDLAGRLGAVQALIVDTFEYLHEQAWLASNRGYYSVAVEGFLDLLPPILLPRAEALRGRNDCHNPRLNPHNSVAATLDGCLHAASRRAPSWTPAAPLVGHRAASRAQKEPACVADDVAHHILWDLVQPFHPNETRRQCQRCVPLQTRFQSGCGAREAMRRRRCL